MNEEQFTKHVVMPFLLRAGFFRIQYTHGVDEHGRDLVFRDTDRFGNEILCGAQVKIGRLTGKSKRRIREALEQLIEGAQAPYQDPTSGRTHRIAMMYLIVSKDITGGAKARFHQALDQYPNIRVLDRHSISLFSDRRDYDTSFAVENGDGTVRFFRECLRPLRLPLLSKGAVLEMVVGPADGLCTFVEVVRVSYDPVWRAQQLFLRLPLSKAAAIPDAQALASIHHEIEEWFAKGTEDLFAFLEEFPENGSSV